MAPIEKAKEALNEIINQDVGTWDKPVSFGILHTRSVDIACDALAALEAENPTYDDATEVADKINAICFDDTMGYDSYMAALLIQQYAESYHAKKCAECKANEAQQ